MRNTSPLCSRNLQRWEARKKKKHKALEKEGRGNLLFVILYTYSQFDTSLHLPTTHTQMEMEIERARQNKDCLYTLLTNNYKVGDLCEWIEWCLSDIICKQYPPSDTILGRVRTFLHLVSRGLCEACQRKDYTRCAKQRDCPHNINQGIVCTSELMQLARVLFIFLLCHVPEFYEKIVAHMAQGDKTRALQFQQHFSQAKLCVMFDQIHKLNPHTPITTLPVQFVVKLIEKLDLPDTQYF